MVLKNNLVVAFIKKYISRNNVILRENEITIFIYYLSATISLYPINLIVCSNRRYKEGNKGLYCRQV